MPLVVHAWGVYLVPSLSLHSTLIILLSCHAVRARRDGKYFQTVSINWSRDLVGKLYTF